MPNINTKFTLSGEKEYKEALSQIGNGMRVLDSEMRKVSSAYVGNADSVEALTAKNDVLERKISKQTERIEMLKAALQQSAEKYDKADKRTMQWQTSLNNAEAELNKLSSELDENKEKIEESGKKTTGLGDALEDVAGKLGINLPDGASKALNALNDVSASTAATAAGFAAVVAVITKVEKALIDMTKEAAEGAKEIETFASITGQSAQQVQQMQYASEKLGVSYDRVRDSLKEITNKMQETENGSEDAKAAFEKLGVELRDSNGELRDAQDVFLDVISALGEVGNQSERDALAMDLMSESAQELNPMIDAGREMIQQYAQAASDMGLVLEGDELKALTDVQSAFYDLEQQQKATKNQLAAEFAPYLTSFYSDMTEETSAFGKTLEDSGIVTAFGELLQFAGELIDPTSVLGQTTLPILEDALGGVALATAIVVDDLRAIVGLFDGLADWIDTGSTQTWKDALSFKATNAVLDAWESGGSSTTSSSGRSGFGGGRSGSGGVINNYYNLDVSNVRSMAQVVELAESAQQYNRKYGR